MEQKLHPEKYAALKLEDQWLEDEMQLVECDFIIRHTREQERILDLGWGSGLVASALHSTHRNVIVVEGAEASVKEAERAGIRAVHSMFEDYEPAADFDCVLASFVLEHVEDPVALLKRCAQWAPRLIAVVGNAESWHRRLAVEMGLQPRLDTLSARDHAVGHYRVYDMESISRHLNDAGWRITWSEGIMFKPLHNAMLAGMDTKLIRAMCSVKVSARDAANIGLICERV